MKLSDFCMVFVCLFMCLFLERDLKIAALAQSQISQIQYNRRMDRVNEDAMMDILVTEYEDGNLLWNDVGLQEQFQHLLKLQFDLTDDDAMLRARIAVTLYEIRQFPYDLSADELDTITSMMGQCLQERDRRIRWKQAHALFLPYIPTDSFTQSVSGVQFFTIFDPDDQGIWYDRVQFSGSRIVKQVRESENNGSLGEVSMIYRANNT